MRQLYECQDCGWRGENPVTTTERFQPPIAGFPALETCIDRCPNCGGECVESEATTGAEDVS